MVKLEGAKCNNFFNLKEKFPNITHSPLYTIERRKQRIVRLKAKNEDDVNYNE